MGEGQRVDAGAARVRAARRERRRRIIRRRRIVAGTLLAAIVFGVVAATAHWVNRTDGLDLIRTGAAHKAPAAPTTTGAPDTTRAGSAVPGAGSPAGPTTSIASSALPLSPAVAAKVPAKSTQVVIVEGAAPGSNTATVRLFERDGGWSERGSWPAHVGRSGWTAHHREGDLKTPIGVFTLSDAGGRLADPGTAMPYTRSSAFRAPAPSPGFGDSAVDAFDYVVAIDYNRVRGTSPLDWTRPMGVGRGGGIWLHVDRGGPTHGCVALPKAGLRFLLTQLDPKQHPVVVMGPTQSL